MMRVLEVDYSVPPVAGDVISFDGVDFSFVDLSATYVPYTGGTADVDLGSFGINANDAYFNDGSTAVYLNDGTFALNVSAGSSYFAGTVGIGYITSAMLGVNYSTSYARLGDGSNIAGVFENGTNVVNLADSTYAINAVSGSIYLGGSITTGQSLLVAETIPYDNSVNFEVSGKGGFHSSGAYQAYFADSSTGYAGYFFDSTGTSAYLVANSGQYAGIFYNPSLGLNTYLATSTHGIDSEARIKAALGFETGADIACNTFVASYFGSFGLTHTAFLGDDGLKAAEFADGTNIVTLCNTTNAIASNGNVNMQGLLSGAGAPATILTNFNLYVDNTTGQLYVD